jgi:hypothetical protein
MAVLVRVAEQGNLTIGAQQLSLLAPQPQPV